MALQGFLLSFSDPGDVPDEEFHNWYNNEHIPARIKVPTFLSWTRWEAADGLHPSFANTYDLQSYEATQRPPYTNLAAMRSELERELLTRVGILDRRHYECYDGPTHPYSATYDVRRPGPYAVFVSLQIKPEYVEEFNKWYDEEHIPMLAKVPGWVRSRRFELRDIRRLGKERHLPQPPRHLAMHEWESLDAFDTEEYKAALSTPWLEKIMQGKVGQERRVMKFLKSFARE
ncbi:hypothetical protein B0H21DRAFT_407137 [Amylocystis lapponica]|nr:hypothetical protein B0H21DRAFT_407137 [Amylocystis lapponica]